MATTTATQMKGETMSKAKWQGDAMHDDLNHANAIRLIGPHRWGGCVAALRDKFGDDVRIVVGPSPGRLTPAVWVKGERWEGDLVGLEGWAEAQYAR